MTADQTRTESARAENLTDALTAVVGASHVITDPDVLAERSTDYLRQEAGNARMVVRPASTAEVAQVVQSCRDAGVPVTVQGGRTSLVAGAVPRHHDVLLSTERLTRIGEFDPDGWSLDVGAGVTLSEAQEVAHAAGGEIGVDLGARESATIGGMVATNAGGLHTIAFGSMGRQVLGLTVVLPTGEVVSRMSEVRADNTGYDLSGLWAGSEGTLGVITEIRLAVRPLPASRAAALLGFDSLADLVRVGNRLRVREGVRALELLSGGGVDDAVDRLDHRRPLPSRHAWYLLVEIAGDGDQTERLADVVSAAGAEDCEVAVAVDHQQRAGLWQLRDAFSEVVALDGPPLKCDLALPTGRIATFADEAEKTVRGVDPTANCILFGHVGEGNLHLNVTGVTSTKVVMTELLRLVALHGGNVSSEHGVGTKKRDYLGLSRTPADLNAMSAIKSAWDPAGLLNPAVMFPDPLNTGASVPASLESGAHVAR